MNYDILCFFKFADDRNLIGIVQVLINFYPVQIIPLNPAGVVQQSLLDILEYIVQCH